MFDMGEIEYCFGLHKFKRNKKLHIMQFNQSEYINDILKTYGIKNYKRFQLHLN
jgi:5,10-methylenetetrahydrofolate reductase